MTQDIIRRATVVALVAVSACTMKKQEAPGLSGPSEFGTAITVTVTPDVITQDGASNVGSKIDAAWINNHATTA